MGFIIQPTAGTKYKRLQFSRRRELFSWHLVLRSAYSLWYLNAFRIKTSLERLANQYKCTLGHKQASLRISSGPKAVSHRQHLCCYGGFYCPGNCSSPQSAGVMGSAGDFCAPRQGMMGGEPQRRTARVLGLWMTLWNLGIPRLCGH